VKDYPVEKFFYDCNLTFSHRQTLSRYGGGFLRSGAVAHVS
jgi:hypothetical protein